MFLEFGAAALACLSFVLAVWQWLAAVRFPLHKRKTPHLGASWPGITLLKPIKGADEFTEQCLESWFAQTYAGPVHILFGVTSPDDPACPVVRRLATRFSQVDMELVVCGPPAGANAKVSKLQILSAKAKHGLLVVSDADVSVPADVLEQLAIQMVDTRNDEPVGLVNCFYELSTASNLAMRWEAMAVNADFWSQVLQSLTLKKMDFALGAVMAVRREALHRIGGFAAIRDCLADDYQLGNRIRKAGFGVELSTVVVECRSGQMRWRDVWKHQLRWARTIRVCQPAPYFFSILSNPTVWPLLWLLVAPNTLTLTVFGFLLAFRIFMALHLEKRLTRRSLGMRYAWMPLFKDLAQACLWTAAFAGNRIEWRGEQMKLRRDGTLVKTRAG